MRIISSTKTAYQALRTNWGRSLLTILGIVIGIVAIVLVVGLGQGAQRLILQEVEGIGGNAVIIRPGRQPEGPTDFQETLFSDAIGDQEIAAISRPENVPNIVSVDPAVIVPGSATFQDQAFRPIMFGWTATAMDELFQISPDQGISFTEDDIRQRSKVAIIGSRVKQELFGESDALGKFIKIKGRNVRVIGIYAPRGQIAFFNVDEVILMPYTTAQKDFLGINYFHEVFIRTDPTADVTVVADDVRATIRELHGITDPAKDDFFVVTQENIIESISLVTDILTIFLVAIASISLVVGGVGIMNIMLVSVTERTHEIGLRKAVGATSQDIQRQFLIEAVILTATGGILGTTFAVVLAWIITIGVRQQFNIAWPFQLPIPAVIIGVATATAIGLLFGIYPARQAAKKDPIEALRHE